MESRFLMAREYRPELDGPARLVAHGDPVTTARTYTHVVADESELDYARLAVA